MSAPFRLTSSETGTTYHIQAHASGTRKPLPAILFMDGDDQFEAAVTAYRARRATGAVPDLLLIGVGYGASYLQPANRRGRDYTPVAHPDEPGSGGGDAFLQFLGHTLWPELKRRYSIDESRRGLAGHSLGSLLVLHALFQPRPFFTHFLASAPSIWWADRAILDQAADLRVHQATLPGRLYLSVGARDTASMTGDLALLEQQLAAKPFTGLQVSSQRFAGRDHYDVLPAAFGAGLAALFGVGGNRRHEPPADQT